MPAVPSMSSPAAVRPRSQRAFVVLAHAAAWLAAMVLLLAFAQPVGGLELGWAGLRLVAPVPLLAGFFYLNYFVLIPRLLARRRFAGYFALVLLIGAAFAAPLVLQHAGLLAAPPLPPHRASASPLRLLGVLLTLVWALSSALRITGEWLRHEAQRRQLHSDQLAAELAFLKAQVNPHFLFNTLNNVYSLAELKSDDAPVAILQLAHLMRYLLYEAAAPQVPLARELEHLRTYVDLERLRLDPDQVPIDFAVTGDPQGLLIEPMLLVPFVENAFKHGVGAPGRSPICLRLQVDEQGLTFTVRNRVAAAGPAPAGPGGVGLANVRQRLALLYPGRHTLALDRPGADFLATLTLIFAHDPAPLPARG